MRIVGFYITVAVFICSCQVEKISVDEKKINDILFAIIDDNPDIFQSDCKLVNGFIDRSDINEKLINTISEYFDQNEIDFLIEQKNKQNEFSIKTRNFKKKYNLLDKSVIDTLENKMERAYSNDTAFDYWGYFRKEIGCMQAFSRPLISKDEKTAIIVYFEVYGSLSAAGFTSIFKYESGRWTLSEELISWVS